MAISMTKDEYEASKYILPERYFGVEIRHTKEYSNPLIVACLNEIYLKAYSKFADWTNPQYEKWNKEYDDFGLPKDGLNSDDTINENSIYNRFIVEKYQPMFRRLEKEYKGVIKEVFAGPDCDFRIRWTDGNETEMRIVPK